MIVTLLIWQWLVATEVVNPLFLASPTQIADELANLFRTGAIWPDLAESGKELAIGLGLAAAVGIVLGMLIGWYKPLGEFLDPLISALYATPRIALVPVLILWLGIGIESKIAIVFLSAVFEILVSASAGVKAMDENVLKAARSFGAKDRQILRTVLLPSSLPFLATGMRLGVGRGLVGVVVGELFAAQAGVGHRLTIAAAEFKIPEMYASLVLISIAGVILTLMLQRVERRFDAWRF